MADSVNFSTTLDQVESLINKGIAEAQSNSTAQGEDSSTTSSVFAQIQSSIGQGIDQARSNSTAQGDTSTSSNSFADFFANNLAGDQSNTSDSSNSSGATTDGNTTTQESLIQIGQQQVAANLGSDSLTNPSEGNSNGAYSYNFQGSDIKPVFDQSTGKVSLEIDGKTVDLFSFSGGSFGGGSSSGGGNNNPLSSGSSEGGNPFGSSSSFGGGSGNPFSSGGFGGGGFGA